MCLVLLSHLLLLVYEIVTGHHHKVVPPSQTSRHRHVLLLEGWKMKNTFQSPVLVLKPFTVLHFNIHLSAYNITYLSDISKQLPFPCE